MLDCWFAMTIFNILKSQHWLNDEDAETNVIWYFFSTRCVLVTLLFWLYLCIVFCFMCFLISSCLLLTCSFVAGYSIWSFIGFLGLK